MCYSARPGGGGLPLLCSSFGASIDIHEFVKLQVDRRNGKNCPDLRNTRVIDLGREFSDYGAVVDIHDPCADRELAAREYGVELMAQPQTGACGAINIAVSHDESRAPGVDGLRRLGNGRAVIYDIKGVLPKDAVDARL